MEGYTQPVEGLEQWLDQMDDLRERYERLHGFEDDGFIDDDDFDY